MNYRVLQIFSSIVMSDDFETFAAARGHFFNLVGYPGLKQMFLLEQSSTILESYHIKETYTNA